MLKSGNCGSVPYHHFQNSLFFFKLRILPNDIKVYILAFLIYSISSHLLKIPMWVCIGVSAAQVVYNNDKLKLSILVSRAYSWMWRGPVEQRFHAAQWRALWSFNGLTLGTAGLCWLTHSLFVITPPLKYLVFFNVLLPVWPSVWSHMDNKQLKEQLHSTVLELDVMHIVFLEL